MGGSKQHDATAPGATARRRKSRPRSRPASAARVPLTSAKQLIFGRKIGEGTQGEVRLARHATTGKRYVVKILDLDDPDDPDDPSTVSSNAAANDAKRQVSSLTDEEARAVETEADCLRMLSHPNVVRCHGTFRLDPTGDDPTSRRRSRLCIVMSHCEGGDLATLLARTKGQPLPEDAVMRWLVQLLLALDHVHSKNVLHRDLKPANVFLSKNLRCVKIGDFGIAKVVETWGAIDVLVSNAGVQIVHPLEDFPFDDWKKLLSIHLDGAFLTSKAVMPHMQKAGSGAIIFMGSVHSKEASALKSAYVTAKHGLLGLARVISKEGAKHGIRANVICPGFVKTPLVEKQIPEQARDLGISEEEVVNKVMLGETVDQEFTTIEDVAEVAHVFAAFPTNALTGQSLVVSHGWYMN